MAPAQVTAPLGTIGCRIFPHVFVVRTFFDSLQIYIYTYHCTYIYISLHIYIYSIAYIYTYILALKKVELLTLSMCVAHQQHHIHVLAVVLSVRLCLWETKQKQENHWIANKWFNTKSSGMCTFFLDSSSPQQSHAVQSRWFRAYTNASAAAWENKEWFLGWWSWRVYACEMLSQNTLSMGGTPSFEIMCPKKTDFTRSKKCSLLLSFHGLQLL